MNFHFIQYFILPFPSPNPFFSSPSNLLVLELMHLRLVDWWVHCTLPYMIIFPLPPTLQLKDMLLLPMPFQLIQMVFNIGCCISYSCIIICLLFLIFFCFKSISVVMIIHSSRNPPLSSFRLIRFLLLLLFTLLFFIHINLFLMDEELIENVPWAKKKNTVMNGEEASDKMGEMKPRVMRARNPLQ